MSGLQILLDGGLVVLLIATMFHALRLERALGVLKRDRAALAELVAGFNGATRQAELGVVHLREAADGAGRHIARHIETATALQQDLNFLTERGNKLADRLEGLLRHARALEVPPGTQAATGAAAAAARGADTDGQPRMRSEAERELLKALRMAR